MGTICRNKWLRRLRLASWTATVRKQTEGHETWHESQLKRKITKYFVWLDVKKGWGGTAVNKHIWLIWAAVCGYSAPSHWLTSRQVQMLVLWWFQASTPATPHPRVVSMIHTAWCNLEKRKKKKTQLQDLMKISWLISSVAPPWKYLHVLGQENAWKLFFFFSQSCSFIPWMSPSHYVSHGHNMPVKKLLQKKWHPTHFPQFFPSFTMQLCISRADKISWNRFFRLVVVFASLSRVWGALWVREMLMPFHAPKENVKGSVRVAPLFHLF